MKTAAEAYTDMMMNLAKSAVNVPIHLQPAVQARSWWESSDSLLSKASIAGEELAKSSHEEEEAEEEATEDDRELSNAHNDVHGGDSAEEEEQEDEEEVDDMDKSIAASLTRFANALEKSTDHFHPKTVRDPGVQSRPSTTKGYSYEPKKDGDKKKWAEEMHPATPGKKLSKALADLSAAADRLG